MTSRSGLTRLTAAVKPRYLRHEEIGFNRLGVGDVDGIALAELDRFENRVTGIEF